MKNIMVGCGLLLGLASCAPITRGVVAMKIDQQEAHVCLGKTEVRVGDKLEVYRNVCPAGYGPTSKWAAARDSSCTKKFLGSGAVTKILNEHYSVAKFPSEIGFEEGDVVEKAKK